MKNLELSIEREIDFLIKYNLTPDELFLIKLIWYAQDGHDEYLSEYFSENQLTLELRDVLLSLQKKGIINKTYEVPEKGNILNPNDVDFNKNVVNSFLKHSQTLGMELFETYPASIIINGRTFSLRNITKLYKSLDEMCFEYGKAIKFNPDIHKEVLELLEWGKENNHINSGLCDFIASHQWLTLQELRDNGAETFNTNELI